MDCDHGCRPGRRETQAHRSGSSHKDRGHRTRFLNRLMFDESASLALGASHGRRVGKARNNRKVPGNCDPAGMLAAPPTAQGFDRKAWWSARTVSRVLCRGVGDPPPQMRPPQSAPTPCFEGRRPRPGRLRLLRRSLPSRVRASTFPNLTPADSSKARSGLVLSAQPSSLSYL